jgi:hypothetical protein
MQIIQIVELVSDTVIEEFDNLALAYEKRDELQQASLELGETWTEKRYAIRQI